MAGTKVERPDVAHAPVVRDPGVPEERAPTRRTPPSRFLPFRGGFFGYRRIDPGRRQVVRRRPRPGPTGGTVKWVTGVELLSMGERVATY